MQKAIPVNAESEFNVDELFFSTTDDRGVILSGNSVFTRVSEFPIEELIGAPHNIIRHPDMPRTVFKLLWDTIKSGQPIGAYVKNMSRTGRYYWVFAMVFPVAGGFISIRLKPTSALRDTVEQLYKSILAEEKKGLEHGVALVLSTLNQLGFKTYAQFMAAALVSEIQSRDEALKKITKSENHLNQDLIQAHFREYFRYIDACEKCVKEFSLIFQSLVQVVEHGTVIRENAIGMQTAFRKLNLLSMNMDIGACKIGEEGATLTEVSTGFKKVADNIKTEMNIFSQSMEKTFGVLNSAQFLIGAARLQIETIRFFLNEVATIVSSGGSLDVAHFETQHKILTKLAQNYTSTVRHSLSELASLVLGFRWQIDNLSTASTGLEVIRVSGNIECAKIDEEKVLSFENKIEEMGGFIQSISSPLKRVLDAVTRLSDGSNICSNHLSAVERQIRNLEFVHRA